MILRCHVKVIFQNDGDDAQTLASSLQVKADELINLKPFNALVRIGNKNHKMLLFRPPKILSPFKKPQENYTSDINFLGEEWVSF